MNPSLMTTNEVAAYLRLKERKIYDLVGQGLIPCTKVTGKLLFPRQAIDLWLMNHLEGDQRSSQPIPTVLAGSQDPLLEWALREANTDMALLCHGSGDGIKRLLDNRAMMAGMHLLSDDGAHYNEPLQLGMGGMRDLVIIHWAWRTQGLLVRPGNPCGIDSLADLARPGIHVGHRQPDAGAETLFRHLLQRAGIARTALDLLPHPALTEDDLALDVREGRADAGLGVEAAARRHGLDFVPLHSERFDLAMRRQSYFEPPIQQLLAFTRSQRFRERSEAMGGYDISELGKVVYNA